jgi:hypothetical protein
MCSVTVGPTWATSASSTSNPGGPQRFHGRGEEPGVEGGDAVHHQGEAQGLGHLVHELAVADSAAVGEVDRLP